MAQSCSLPQQFYILRGLGTATSQQLDKAPPERAPARLGTPALPLGTASSALCSSSCKPPWQQVGHGLDGAGRITCRSFPLFLIFFFFLLRHHQATSPPASKPAFSSTAPSLPPSPLLHPQPCLLHSCSFRSLFNSIFPLQVLEQDFSSIFPLSRDRIFSSTTSHIELLL